MAIVMTFDSKAGFLRVTLSGRWPEIPEQMRERQRARDSGFLGPETPVLLDLRGLTEGLPDQDAVRLAIIATRQSEGWARKRAIVVENHHQFAAASLFAGIVGPDLRIFSVDDEAVAWLAGCAAAV